MGKSAQPPPTKFGPSAAPTCNAAVARGGIATAQAKTVLRAPLPPPTRFGSSSPVGTSATTSGPKAHSGAAQPMYRINNRAVFKTSKGSRYTITHGGVRRERYRDGGVSEGAKNIFYVDYDESEEILTDRGRGMTGVHVEKVNNRYYLVYDVRGVRKNFRIHREPKLGYATLDLLLPPDGTVPDINAAGFHIGDAITEIIWRPDR